MVGEEINVERQAVRRKKGLREKKKDNSVDPMIGIMLY